MMQADHDWFPRTERLLWRYYATQDRIERLQAQIGALEDRLAQISMDIAGARSIRSITQALSFAPASGWSDPGIDAELEHMEERVTALLEEYTRRRRQVIEKRTRLAALREETAVIDTAMQRLTRDEREVAKLRYRRPGMNNCEIAAALYCSEGWVRLTRKRLVRKIAEGIGIL
jgi:DNA repair exonuclease SbcCD ATPase subunit